MLEQYTKIIPLYTGPGWQKYFTSWEPRFLGQYFARDSVIHGQASAL